MDSMYEILLELPLFQGASVSRISEIVGKAKFHFLKYLPHEKIIDAREECTHMKFIISGSVRVTAANADGRFKVSQTLSAPNVICPDFLFGRETRYPVDVVANDTVAIVQLTKQDFLDILNSDRIFLFNYLNIISVNAQKAVGGVLAVAAGALEERIAFWIIALTQPGGTDIKLTCRQRDLYSLFGVQRSSFLNTLERMKAMGMIDYDSTEIRIVSRRALLDLILHSPE